MSESDLEQLATFMGHTIGIHRQSYRLPDDVYQTSKIAKILLLLEKGDVGQFKGKTLDQIDVNMDQCLIEEDKENQANPNDEQELIADVPEPLNDVNEVQIARIETENTVKKNGKQQRTLVPWTDQQKKVVCSFFAKHIQNKKPPKRSECETLKNTHTQLLDNKDWLKIKVYVQNKYSGKCKSLCVYHKCISRTRLSPTITRSLSKK
ncbi:hypothetical protein PPYR_00007 [Photinus pyralis]|uniref:Uncharacterized protein n=2 Tax=Photinus pyralis TaxID=7054 RepID=A0A5N4B0A6_PHOPY|nr:hypothetical protein PPYR_00007 [Photinus pyralis]